MSEGSGDNIHVLVRVRPPKVPTTLLETGATGELVVNTAPPRSFVFDSALPSTSTQEDVWRAVGRPAAEACLAGYNACVFAFGQTGSGKTHTMLGPSPISSDAPSPHRGLLPRVLEFLFNALDTKKADNPSLSYSITISFLEIYKERIYDLLAPVADDVHSTSLSLREDTVRGVYVENLSEEVAETTSDALKVLGKGARNRTVAATAMNRASSRAHSVFTLDLQIKTRGAKGGDGEGIQVEKVVRSKFHLIDLAGSERQRRTGADGERLKEAGSINKSLSALGNVISALAHNQTKKKRKQQRKSSSTSSSSSSSSLRHVHYRDSKLTFLLKDSLGGNSRTAVVATVSPEDESLGETLSTLKFAERAKQVENRASVNELLSASVPHLQAEIKRLKAMLEEGGGGSVGGGGGGKVEMPAVTELVPKTLQSLPPTHPLLRWSAVLGWLVEQSGVEDMTPTAALHTLYRILQEASQLESSESARGDDGSGAATTRRGAAWRRLLSSLGAIGDKVVEVEKRAALMAVEKKLEADRRSMAEEKAELMMDIRLRLIRALQASKLQLKLASTSTPSHLLPPTPAGASTTASPPEPSPAPTPTPPTSSSSSIPVRRPSITTPASTSSSLSRVSRRSTPSSTPRSTSGRAGHFLTSLPTHPKAFESWSREQLFAFVQAVWRERVVAPEAADAQLELLELRQSSLSTTTSSSTSSPALDEEGADRLREVEEELIEKTVEAAQLRALLHATQKVKVVEGGKEEEGGETKEEEKGGKKEEEEELFESVRSDVLAYFGKMRWEREQELESRVSELEEVVVEEKKRADGYRRHVSEEERKREALEVEVRRAVEEKEDLDRRAMSLERMVEGLKKEKDAGIGEVMERYEGEKLELLSQLATAKREAVVARDEALEQGRTEVRDGELKEMQGVVEKLETERKAMEEMIAANESKMHALEARVVEAEGVAEELGQKTVKLEGEVASRGQAAVAEKRRADQAIFKLESLEEDLDGLTTQVNYLNRRRKEAMEKAAEFEIKWKREVELRERGEAERGEEEEEARARLHKQVCELEEELVAWKDKSNNADERASEAEKSREEVGEELSNLREAFNEARAELDSARMKLQEQTANAREEAGKWEEDVERWKERCTEAEEEAAEKAKETERAKESVEHMEARVADLRAEVEKASSETLEARGRAEAAEAELEAVKYALKFRKPSPTPAPPTISSTSASSSASPDRASSSWILGELGQRESELSRALDTIESMNSKLVEVEEAQRDAEARLSVEQSRAERSERRQAELSTEVESLRTMVSTLSEQNRELKAKVGGLEAEGEKYRELVTHFEKKSGKSESGVEGEGGGEETETLVLEERVARAERGERQAMEQLMQEESKAKRAQEVLVGMCALVRSLASRAKEHVDVSDDGSGGSAAAKRLQVTMRLRKQLAEAKKTIKRLEEEGGKGEGSGEGEEAWLWTMQRVLSQVQTALIANGAGKVASEGETMGWEDDVRGAIGAADEVMGEGFSGELIPVDLSSTSSSSTTSTSAPSVNKKQLLDMAMEALHLLQTPHPTSHLEAPRPVLSAMSPQAAQRRQEQRKRDLGGATPMKTPPTTRSDSRVPLTRKIKLISPDPWVAEEKEKGGFLC